MRRSLSYPALGAALALGAPAGAWLLRAIAGLQSERALFAYLFFGTTLAFASFGAVIGKLADALAAQNAELLRLARTDALTGAANRRAFQERLQLERARASRTGSPLSLIIVDLDHFKRVNDTFGHGAGDVVLAGTVASLAKSIRDVDLLARIGGEEFAILCPDAKAKDAARIAERARAAIAAAPIRAEKNEIPITASFGVAQLRGDVEALIRDADDALYAAKEGGRNRVHVA